MANYVIDATIVLHYLLAQTYTTNARLFFNQITPSDRLVVPEFCLVECTNVIWKQVRFFSMSSTDGAQTLKDLRALPLYRTPVKQMLNRAMEVGLRQQLAVYDAVYITLAQKTGYPLISTDQLQQKAAINEGVVLKPITDFQP